MKGRLNSVLKMFSTQLNSLFQKIMNDEAFNIEDAARLLAQAAISDGTIYIQGFDEMMGVSNEAINGIEPLIKAKKFHSDAKLTYKDRFLLFSRYSDDKEAIQLAQRLKQEKIPFVAVSTIVETTAESLDALADIHINLRVQRGLIPDESGNRTGYPSLLVALFTYFGIKLTLEEILQEYEEE